MKTESRLAVSATRPSSVRLTRRLRADAALSHEAGDHLMMLSHRSAHFAAGRG